MRGRDTRRWRLIRKQAFARDCRDQAPCWICGGAIDYGAKPGTPDAWEPDHYMLVSEHPELAECLENLRPSHSRCNRSTKNRTKRMAGDIGTPSREW